MTPSHGAEARTAPDTVAERFWRSVEKTDTCWLWTLSTDGRGYGKFKVEGKTVRVARFSYELLVGPIPEGLQIDHLCRVRHCVNPAHLEAVTQQENTRRAEHYERNLTHCLRGHPFDERNTHYRKDGSRTCRACERGRIRGRASRVDYLERGRLVKVLVRWGLDGGPRNVLIERSDGSRVVRPFRGLRVPA